MEEVCPNCNVVVSKDELYYAWSKGYKINLTNGHHQFDLFCSECGCILWVEASPAEGIVTRMVAE